MASGAALAATIAAVAVGLWLGRTGGEAATAVPQVRVALNQRNDVTVALESPEPLANAEVRVELHAYDAGTDSGTTYTSSDRQTVPAEPIGRVGYPLTDRGNTRPLGSFTFKRLDN